MKKRSRIATGQGHNIQRQKPIKSRIIAASLLAPMTPAEISAMIVHRCKLAEIPNPFTSQTLERLYELMAGVPHESLKYCALAYQMMLMAGERKVSVDLLESAYDEGVLVA